METHEKDTQDCLAKEDNKQALDCLKKVVKQYAGTDTCRPKLVLLVQEGCIPCKEVMALHKDDIAMGIVEKIDVDSPRGRAIAQENDVYSIPSLLLLDCKNKLIPFKEGAS